MEGAHAKIFGIGLSKTGTSSLAQALQSLGFKTRDNMGATRYTAGDLASIDMATVETHDALTDTPIPSFYRELDARFPGSRFILTVRDREGWLKSCMKQFNSRFAAGQSESNRRLFEDLYGTNEFDPALFAAGYDRFVAGALEYFKDRPGDLLVLNVTAGEGWEKLCPFLGRSIPEVPFPKANVTQIRWMKIEELVAVAEAAGRELMQHFEGGATAGAPETGAGTSGLAKKLLGRAVRIALRRDAGEAAFKAAQKTLVSGLRKLNSDIPMLSPAGDPVPHGERKHWNHFWLLNPLAGRSLFEAGRGGFAVTVALIEDGRPIYGVVHSPAEGVTCFGRVGKGAFKASLGKDAVRISPDKGAVEEDSAQAEALRDEAAAASSAMALGRALASWPTQGPAFGPAMEWDVAAAHAVVRAAGLRVCDPSSGAELVYNGRSLSVGRSVVCR
jgi:3'-phosphoadenosine 5'-phosphosulfate (PAPS) 3'-phosphatase